jgi:hypothetical protein
MNPIHQNIQKINLTKITQQEQNLSNRTNISKKYKLQYKIPLDLDSTDQEDCNIKKILKHSYISRLVKYNSDGL